MEKVTDIQVYLQTFPLIYTVNNLLGEMHHLPLSFLCQSLYTSMEHRPPSKHIVSSKVIASMDGFTSRANLFVAGRFSLMKLLGRK